MNQVRSAKQARLAEVHRYRVVSTVGTSQGQLPPMPIAPPPSSLTERTLSVVDRTVRARGQRERLVSEVERAGLRMRPEEWVVIQAATVLVVGVLFALLLRSPLGVFVGALVGFVGTRLFIHDKITRRQNAFAEQLPDTLQLLAGSIRTGFSLNQAIAGIVREGTEPTASEFARTLTEVRLGADLEQALDATADRMNCEDLHWVVMAVRISREVGGNLGEVLETTMTTMRQRAELRGQVRILSAEGRISARILTALPFVVGLVLAVTNRRYLHPLFHTGAGIAMLAVGLGLLAIGSFWLSRLVKIEV
jgi:tight adherence protein B